MLKKKIWANFQRIIELFAQKFVTRMSKIWVRDPGTGIRDPEKTYSGSRIQGSKKHRIPDPDPQPWKKHSIQDPDPQHWLSLNSFLINMFLYNFFEIVVAVSTNKAELPVWIRMNPHSSWKPASKKTCHPDPNLKWRAGSGSRYASKSEVGSRYKSASKWCGSATLKFKI